VCNAQVSVGGKLLVRRLFHCATATGRRWLCLLRTAIDGEAEVAKLPVLLRA
jgi:hypothetical protein